MLKPTHHPKTASRVFGDDAVVITPAENTVRMLNPVGSRIWQLADGSRTIDEIAAVLTEEFDVEHAEAEASVERFVAELIELNLLTWTEQ